MKKIAFICAFALLSAGLTVPVAHAVDVLGVDIHGFASQGFLLGTNNWPTSKTEKGTFGYNDFAINFSKELGDNLHLGIQFSALDRGAYGKDDVTIDWAYADYRFKDWFGIRAGKVKIPMGLYNETRDLDSARTYVLLPQGIYDDANREINLANSGVAIYGVSPATPVGTFSYLATAGKYDIPTDGGLAEIGKTMFLQNLSSTDTDTAFAYKLEYSPVFIDGLKLQGTGFHTSFSAKGPYNGTFGTNQGLTPVGSEIDMKFKNLRRYVLSAEYVFHDLVVSGEYMVQTAKVDAFINNLHPVDTYNKLQAYYGGATYRFAEWFELGGYYSIYYPDRDHKHGTAQTQALGLPEYSNWQKDAALTLRFDPYKNLTIKTEGHYINGTGLVNYNRASAKEDSYLFAAKVTASF